mgnify:CR=1 FL=1
MNDWNRDETFLARWLSDELTPEELQAFEQSKDFEKFLKIKETLNEVRPLEFDTDKELAALREHQQPETPIRKLSFGRQWLVAASVIFIAGIFLVYQIGSRSNEPITTQTAVAIKSSLELPDGSQVKLNSESSVSYKRKGWSENRVLQLSGEAFFEVKKGERFEVETSLGTVEVLGTSFNIRERNNKLEVACYTGRVRVASGQNEVILTPGEGIRIEEGVSLPMQVSGAGPGWLTGVMSFVNVPLTEALEELGRQLGYHINTEDLDIDPIYNGDFPTHSVESAASVILDAFDDIDYTIDKDHKLITVTSIK